MSQWSSTPEELMIGSDDDGVQSSRKQSEECRGSLPSQVLHFSAFGDGSGAYCRHGRSAREWHFV